MADLKTFIREIKSLIDSGEAETKGDEFWLATGSRTLDIIDSVVDTGKANFSTPKEYSKETPCILDILFDTLVYLPNPNRPFSYNREDNLISFYELAYTRCCTYICQLLGDRTAYVQKLLIKYLFSQHYICSMLASDVYVFIMRIIHPNQRTAMCQLVMNLCQVAPPDAVTKGASFIDRVKHPTVNFDNPRYRHVLDSL